MGVKAAVHGKLVVSFESNRRFWQKLLEREREPIIFAGPDSRIASSMVEQVTLNH